MHRRTKKLLDIMSLRSKEVGHFQLNVQISAVFPNLASDPTPPTNLMLPASNLVWLLFSQGGIKAAQNSSKV